MVTTVGLHNVIPKHVGSTVLVTLMVLTCLICCCRLPAQPDKPSGNECPYPDTAGPVDEADPIYRILSPNGYETFMVGQQCTIRVTSTRPATSAALFLVMGTRRLAFSPPPFNEEGVSLPGEGATRTVVLTIPDSLESQSWDPSTMQTVTTRISSISDSCIIRIKDYSNARYNDHSDCFFRIIGP